MRTYQTLSLIGCILGMLLTFGLLLTMSFLSGTMTVLMNVSKNLSPSNPHAMDEFWKLKALDSLNNNIPGRERKAIVDSMIGNEKIKKLLYRMNYLYFCL